MAEVPAPSSIIVDEGLLRRLRWLVRGLEAEEIQVAKRGVIRHVTFWVLGYLVFCF